MNKNQTSMLSMVFNGIILGLSYMFFTLVFTLTDYNLLQLIIYWIVFAGLLFMCTHIIMNIRTEYKNLEAN